MALNVHTAWRQTPSAGTSDCQSLPRGAAAMGFVVAIIFGCTRGDAGSDAEGTQAITSRDSTGITIVDVPGTLVAAVPAWTFSTEPTVSIGQVAGEAPYLFQMIGAARRLSTGEVMITDLSLELRIFGADGRFLRKFGRRGSGPGEFDSFPMNMSASDGRRVAIYDRENGSLTSIDLVTGEFTSTPVSTECAESGDTTTRRCNVVRPLPNGTVFTTRALPVSAAGDASKAAIAQRMELDPSLNVRHLPGARYGLLRDSTFQLLVTARGSVNVRSGFGADFLTTTALFEPGGQVAFGSDVFVAGDPHSFELRVYADNGRLNRIIRVMAEPVPITAELLNHYGAQAESSRFSAPAKEYIATLRPEGSVPFFGGLLVDRAGRIWLSEYKAPAPWGSPSRSTWLILDADGRPLARLAANRAGTILEAGADYVLLRETDSDGVEFVRMYSLVAAPG